MKLTFDGGTDTVTGSMHWIEVGGRRILRDCGLFQGRRAESAQRNREFRFSPDSVDALVLSHAHIDHCGNIPSLARAGCRAPVHATEATRDLCDIMLRDAAFIQEQDAAYLNQKTNRQGLPPVEPLYTMADAEAALRLFRGHPYGRPVEVAPGVTVTYRDAGHILGAALTVFDLEENGRRVRVGFAFDLGRRNLPLIRDPEILSDIDTLIIESTYGDRLHDDARTATERLGEVVRETLGRGGRLFIPSFALERAQEILYHLNVLQAAGRIERCCAYLDSPMATRVAKVFEQHIGLLDEDTHALMKRQGSIFPPWVRFTASVEDSKRLTASGSPCIVIAASGMCEHGRILHHLKHGIGDPRNAVAIVGYQASYTLGRRLVEGDRQVRIFGDMFDVRATIHTLNAFSAHADRNDLIEYVQAVRPRRTFLVHGEEAARTALAGALRARNLGEVFTPARGDSVEL